jgi:hypothetical protein
MLRQQTPYPGRLSADAFGPGQPQPTGEPTVNHRDREAHGDAIAGPAAVARLLPPVIETGLPLRGEITITRKVGSHQGEDVEQLASACWVAHSVHSREPAGIGPAYRRNSW